MQWILLNTRVEEKLQNVSTKLSKKNQNSKQVTNSEKYDLDLEYGKFK